MLDVIIIHIDDWIVYVYVRMLAANKVPRVASGKLRIQPWVQTQQVQRIRHLADVEGAVGSAGARMLDPAVDDLLLGNAKHHHITSIDASREYPSCRMTMSVALTIFSKASAEPLVVLTSR